MKRIQKLLVLLPDQTVYDRVSSPVGELILFASDKGLHHVFWEHEAQSEDFQISIQAFKQDADHPVIVKAKTQLSEYFEGKRQVFDIPLCPHGTDFQLSVWQELRQIPYGETISYGEQARRLGDKNKARAVGLANGLNPISIIVPCHRVIGSNGSLTGFGGGLDNKAKLLEIEKGCSSL
ncbi:methylated-DNA--[protein]-cysteine S-methyltransferase [Cysteiniphilum sp. 6C5]|uniref:methylated-DNA--[protein]-cysteine S-methyltransferase n=1 Tax=unclassified Cysteiniphilum TaxID=2610889 RepID=UPI003F840EDF